VGKDLAPIIDLQFVLKVQFEPNHCQQNPRNLVEANKPDPNIENISWGFICWGELIISSPSLDPDFNSSGRVLRQKAYRIKTPGLYHQGQSQQVPKWIPAGNLSVCTV
jgi:hypothetical protein